MKTLQFIAGTVAVSAKQYSYVLSFLNGRYSLALLLAWLGLYNPSFTQSADTLALNVYGFSITTEPMPLQIGESAEFVVSLGTAETPVENAKAFQVLVTLGSEAIFPTSPSMTLGSFWFFDGSQSYSEVLADASTKTLSMGGYMNDGQIRTGSGELFRFSLVAAEDDVQAESLLAAIGGGYVIVDNIMMKKEPLATEELAPVAYPNPCRSNLYLDWKGQVAESAVLWDQQGRRILELDASALVFGQIHTDGITPGDYILEMNYQGGQQRKRIQVEPMN